MYLKTSEITDAFISTNFILNWDVLFNLRSRLGYLQNKDDNIHKEYNMPERGDNGVFITLVPKVFFKNCFLILWLNNFEDFWGILIGWFMKLSVQTFQPLISIYRRVNFVYHHWASIYQPLSYPFYFPDNIYILAAELQQIWGLFFSKVKEGGREIA